MRPISAALILAMGLALAGCTPFAGFVADHWPRWAGGMPPDVPPRPGTPGYEEFIAHRTAPAESAKPAEGGPGPNSQSTPPVNAGGTPTANRPAVPAGNADAVPGGLY
jgi:hypothetical protein